MVFCYLEVRWRKICSSFKVQSLRQDCHSSLKRAGFLLHKTVSGHTGELACAQGGGGRGLRLVSGCPPDGEEASDMCQPLSSPHLLRGCSTDVTYGLCVPHITQCLLMTPKPLPPGSRWYVMSSGLFCFSVWRLLQTATPWPLLWGPHGPPHSNALGSCSAALRASTRAPGSPPRLQPWRFVRRGGNLYLLCPDTPGHHFSSVVFTPHWPRAPREVASFLRPSQEMRVQAPSAFTSALNLPEISPTLQ